MTSKSPSWSLLQVRAEQDKIASFLLNNLPTEIVSPIYPSPLILDTPPWREASFL